MISGRDIVDLNSIFVSRGARLFHACQFRDFCSYIDAGGIPSRSLLEQQGLPFTSFDTDTRDHENEVWDKVFLNLHDFGSTFARGGAAVPNTFGPILFVLHSNTFSCATDVAICMRSAGAYGFNREVESIAIGQVEDIFAHPMDVVSPQKSYVKFARALRDVFPDAHNPEVSCTVNGNFIPLCFVKYIMVDPYVVAGSNLSVHVRNLLSSRNLDIRVIERSVVTERRSMYNILATAIENNNINSVDALLKSTTSDAIHQWAESVRPLWYQVLRYSNYFNEGTLSAIR